MIAPQYGRVAREYALQNLSCDTPGGDVASSWHAQLCAIIRSETTARASTEELAVKTFKPSDVNVTIKYGKSSLGGS
jgi:hypothetical protein